MVTAADWQQRGRRLALPDGDVFVVDLAEESGGPAGTPVLALHGFPTSSWDFAGAARPVAGRRRVVLFDCLGFGFSDRPARFAYSVMEQADVAVAVATALHLDRVHLWAHDMGGTVASELLARRQRGLLPLAVDSLALMNSGVYAEMSSPAIGQRLLMSRLGPRLVPLIRKPLFVAQLRRIMGRPPSANAFDDLWTLASREHGQAGWPEALRFMEDRARFRDRWVGALRRSGLPTLIAWGMADRVTGPAVAERLVREIPGARLEGWAGLGHLPHLEDPDRVGAAVAAFFAQVEAGRT